MSRKECATKNESENCGMPTGAGNVVAQSRKKKGKANSPVEKLAPNLLTKTKSSGESEPSQTKSG